MFGIPSPYVLAAKLAGVAILVVGFFALVMSWSARGQEINSLSAWQDSVVIATTDATAEPDKAGKRPLLKPAQVPAAIAGLKRGLDSCHAAREQQNTIVAESVKRADLSDAALANANVLFSNEYGSVRKRIEALAQTKAAPTPELQCQAIGADSKAAWEGWK